MDSAAPTTSGACADGGCVEPGAGDGAGVGRELGGGALVVASAAAAHADKQCNAARAQHGRRTSPDEAGRNPVACHAHGGLRKHAVPPCVAVGQFACLGIAHTGQMDGAVAPRCVFSFSTTCRAALHCTRSLASAQARDGAAHLSSVWRSSAPPRTAACSRAQPRAGSSPACRHRPAQTYPEPLRSARVTLAGELSSYNLPTGRSIILAMDQATSPPQRTPQQLAEHVRDGMFANDRASKALGMTIVEVAPRRARC